MGTIAGLVVLGLLVLAFTRNSGPQPQAPSNAVVDPETAYLAHQNLTRDGISTINELASLLAEVDDPMIAQLKAPLIKGAVFRINHLAINGDRLPRITAEIQARLSQEFGAEREASLAALKAQLLRVRGNRPLASVLGPAISQGLGSH